MILGGVLGGLLFLALGVPAGGIIGAVVGSAAVNMATLASPLAPSIRTAGLVLFGSILGGQLDLNSFRQLAPGLPLAVAALLLLLGVSVLLAFLLTRRFGGDRMTALFSCVPGGLSEVVATAQDAGARTDVVAAVHIIRVFVVVLVVLPLLVTFGDGP